MAPAQTVFVLSDGTGETAEEMVNAALTQFGGQPTRVRRITNVRTNNQVYGALDEAARQASLVVYTIVNRDLAQLVHDECNALGLLSLDLLTPLLTRLAEFVGHSPKEAPGLHHNIDEDYFRRIEAVEFTVKHDDGQELRDLYKADLILTGVSRTSKTPLSMYLAHRGYKVANVPLVNGIAPPNELLQLDPERVVGLVIDPSRLAELRSTRLRNIGQTQLVNSYADFERIEDEISAAKSIFRKNRWVIIDVTGKAVEETASEILGRLHLP